MATKVTRKGQVTIPKQVRDHWGIRPGSKVDFVIAPDGALALVKVDGERPVSRLESIIGISDTGMTTDEIMKLMRGEADAT